MFNKVIGVTYLAWTIIGSIGILAEPDQDFAVIVAYALLSIYVGIMFLQNALDKNN